MSSVVRQLRTVTHPVNVPPALTLARVVSVAAPMFTAVNWGLSPVPSPSAVAAVATVVAPVPPEPMGQADETDTPAVEMVIWAAPPATNTNVSAAER